MDEETDNNATRRVCDACLSGDRDLFSIADPLRLHRLLLGAVTDVDHFVPSAELVAAMALCWECNLNVSKMFRFCERVCRAQMYVGRSDEDRDKESSNVPLSTLNSVIKVGFDLELLHNDDPNIWSSSPPILPSSILDELSGLYCKNSEHRTSNTKTQILVVQEHLNCEYVQELEPEDAVVIPPCYTMKIKNAATENARQTIPITSVRTGDKDILKSTKQTLVIAKMQARNVPVKKQGKIVTILMSEGDMSRRRDEERTTAKYVTSPYKCESCIKGYKFVTTLLAHNKKKHDTENNPYYCDICLERFPYDIQRKLHRESHFLLYACTCGFTHHLYAVAKVHCEPMPNVNPADELTVDSTDESLAKPKRNPKRPRDYICHLCNKVFKSRSHLRYHKQARHMDGFPCDVCGKALVTQSALKKHRDIIHGTDVPLLECPECRKQYRGHEALARHKRCLHGAAGPPEQRYCVACGVLYKTRKHYDFHLRTSLKHIDKNKYKYVCSKCEKRFWHPGELKSHEAWHDDESLFQCSICHKCLSNRITLKNHVRFVHEKRTLPKNKVCDVCGHNFNSKSSLENHIRTHTGERPFQCNVCNANFAHSGALYTHNKLKHLKLKRGESVAKGLREQTEADVAQEPTHSA